MKKAITILFAPLLFTAFGQGSTPASLLLFDGLYETKCVYEEDDDEGSQSYLRFYQDGQVISVGTDCEGTIDELMDWFHINAGQVSKGKYTLKGTKINFSTTGPTGTVHYKGKITDSQIKLSWRSSINGEKGRESYTFIRLSELK